MQNIWEGCFSLIPFLEAIEFPYMEDGGFDLGRGQ